MRRQLSVTFSGHSTAGKKAINQDAFAAHLATGPEADLKGASAVICDGVSSCDESHIASQTAVTSFISDYFSTPPNWSVRKAATKVLYSLNNWVYQQNASRSGTQDSLLTTFSAAILKSNTLHCFHAGDTRIYQQRGDNLELLTTDHVRTEFGHEFLARALGAEQHLQMDYIKRDLEVGDRLLFTSDGVHGYLAHDCIKKILGDTGLSIESISQTLVDQALQAGSDDNLTALVAQVDELPQETLDETHRRLTALPIPPVMAVGNKIDDYEVLDIIFSGTRSHMYLVKDLVSAQHFVLKTPSENFTEDPIYLDGFMREDWVGQRIDHPNVMKTYHPGREKNFMYYLGEHIEGKNLREWIQDNPNPPLEAVRKIVKQAVAGIRAFNRADMIHQDLKPENIMINQDGRVKILDFGTVLIAGTDEISSPLDKSVPQGSVNYVAPEYLMAEKGTARSDLFSLAVIVYEMITGKLPYREASIKQVKLNSYGDISYIPSTHHRRDVPLWVEGCLRKALQPNPRHRYESFSEFERDFTVPNSKLEISIREKPLIERNPVRVWQGIALILFILNLLQLMPQLPNDW